MKTDKGNKVVILDNRDCIEMMDNLLKTGPYTEQKKNPFNKTITTVKKTLKTCNNIITPYIQRQLTATNPTLAKMYGLPKIHKPGNTMRPIVSNINTLRTC